MTLPVVPRSELERVRSERDAWRRRAEGALRRSPVREVPSRGARARWSARLSRLVFSAALLTTGLVLGALTLSSSSEATLGHGPDYPSCIGKARYEAPIEGNQYQELVNALYSCGVYTAP